MMKEKKRTSEEFPLCDLFLEVTPSFFLHYKHEAIIILENVVRVSAHTLYTLVCESNPVCITLHYAMLRVTYVLVILVLY